MVAHTSKKCGQIITAWRTPVHSLVDRWRIQNKYLHTEGVYFKNLIGYLNAPSSTMDKFT